MSFKDWLDNSIEETIALGPRKGSRAAAYNLWEGVLRGVGQYIWNYGTPVYERDWDVLLVLDACRPDALEEVRDEYEFLKHASFDTHMSPASNSAEWMEKTFTDKYSEEMRQTAHITANPHSPMLNPSEFQLFDAVWQYARPDGGGIPPSAITDRVIETKRAHDPSRLIAHYMQPHLPFRAERYPEDSEIDTDIHLGHSEDGLRNVYYRLRDNDVPEKLVWDAYLDNLRWVLDSVEVLVENIDAGTVVITADHTELFGEYGVYCHPQGVPLPPLKRVPWVEVETSDSGTYNPELDPHTDETESVAVEDRLEDLGYL